jgi:hypothetical protein
MERTFNNFGRSNPALDKALQECTDPRLIPEILAAHGMTSRHGSGVCAVVPDSNVTPSQSPAPSSGGFEFEREVRFAESTGKQTLIIRAHSLEALNLLEKQVTGEI